MILRNAEVDRGARGRWVIVDGTSSERGFLLESRVADVIAAEYPIADDVRIRATPSRKTDGGLDIEIRTRKTIDLFGAPYRVQDNRQHVIYVDCKYSDHRTLDWERLVPSVEKTAGKSIDCFVFATNSRLGAKALSLLTESFQRIGVKFRVVECEQLAQWLLDRSAMIGEFAVPLEAPQPITVERQTVTEADDDSVTVHMYARINNNTDERQPCRLLLAKNSLWRLETEADLSSVIARKLILAPRETLPIHLTASSVTSSDADVMTVYVEWDGGSIPIDFVARDVQLTFEPEFQGDVHKQIRNEIAEAITESRGFTCINVKGDAGTGKSRVIREGIAAARSNVVRTARILLEEGSSDVTVVTQLSQKVADALALPPPPLFGDVTAAMTWALDEAPRPFTRLILLIEDLHHAPASLFRVLRRLFARDRNSAAGVVLILTGRHDYTYINRDYYGFLDELTETKPPAFTLYSVPPLSDTDAAALVKATVRGIPEFAVEQIRRLGGNNPFNLVQCIEFLLDQELAVVLNRNTVGIVDVRGFRRRLGLPKEMTKVFALRFDSLLNADDGAALQTVLYLASLIGFQPPERILDYGGRPRAEVRAILASRRFLRIADGMEWVHENVLHFVRELAASRSEEARIARLISADISLQNVLEPLRRAQVASLAGKHTAAVALYGSMLEEIAAVTNFSTLDVPTTYYDHIPAAFRSVLATSGDRDLLSRLLKIGCWIGTNRLSIIHCERAAAFARDVIETIGLSSGEAARLEAWLKQIEAHSQIDSGWTSSARSNLLELECSVQAMPSLASDALLRFDLYNRMQAMYGVYNHLELMQGYGELASNAARESGDKALESKQLLDDAIWYQFIDYKRCLRDTRRGLEQNNRFGTELHRILGELSLAAAEMPQHTSDESWLERSITDIQRMRDQIYHEQLWPVLPRICLLLSALYLLSSRRDRKLLDMARHYADAGLEASVKYTIGFTVWQLRNMRAIIAGHIKPDRPAEIEEHLESAVELLHHEDLLFLGNASFTCANMLVITNYLRFIARERPQEIEQFLPRLRLYDSIPFQNPQQRRSIIDAILRSRYQVILWRGRLPRSVIIDDRTGLAYAVAF